jgi:hypothetical protein
MSEWRPFSKKPHQPVQAEIFYGNLTLADQDGNAVSPLINPWRDERRQIAYWDGETWRNMGTGHALNEFEDDPVEWIPTHWRPLPPLPEIKNDK